MFNPVTSSYNVCFVFVKQLHRRGIQHQGVQVDEEGTGFCLGLLEWVTASLLLCRSIPPYIKHPAETNKFNSIQLKIGILHPEKRVLDRSILTYLMVSGLQSSRVESGSQQPQCWRTIYSPASSGHRRAEYESGWWRSYSQSVRLRALREMSEVKCSLMGVFCLYALHVLSWLMYMVNNVAG